MKRTLSILFAILLVFSNFQPTFAAKATTIDAQEKKILDTLVTKLETIKDKKNPVYMKFFNTKYTKVNAKTLRIYTTLVRFREDSGLDVFDCSYYVELDIEGKKKTLMHYSIENEGEYLKTSVHPLTLSKGNLAQVEKDLRKIYKPHVVDRAMNFETPEGYTPYKNIKLRFVDKPAGTFTDPRPCGLESILKTRMALDRFEGNLEFGVLDYIKGPEAELVRQTLGNKNVKESDVAILVKVRLNLKNLKMVDPEDSLYFEYLLTYIDLNYKNGSYWDGNIQASSYYSDFADPDILKKYPLLRDLLPLKDAEDNYVTYKTGDNIMTEGWILLTVPKDVDNIRLSIKINEKVRNNIDIYYELEKRIK